MQQQSYNNYWRLNLLEFPTKGILYPKNTIIKVRPMNVQEIKYLSTMNEETASYIINEIIEKCCIFIGIEYDDLYLADREYIIFWLRVNSFTKQNGYDITIEKCKNCGEKIIENIKLTDFETIFIQYNAPEIHLDDANINIKLKYPQVKDLDRIYNEDFEIENIIRHLDIDAEPSELLKFILHLSALDYTKLCTYVDKMFIGFNRDITIYCHQCNEPHKYQLIFKDYGLLGNVNLFEILEVIARICKYSNYQIPDDQPWMEVELLEEVINKMAEEEKEASDKEKGKLTMSNHSIPSNITNKIQKPSFSRNSFHL